MGGRHNAHGVRESVLHRGLKGLAVGFFVSLATQQVVDDTIVGRPDDVQEDVIVAHDADLAQQPAGEDGPLSGRGSEGPPFLVRIDCLIGTRCR